MAAARAPGFYAYGDGLFLKISPGGGKSWVVRLTLKGKRLSLGLGPVDLLGLAEARTRAVEWRRLAREGQDPRRVGEASRRTLRAATREFHAAQSPGWAQSHASRWLSSMERDILPKIGDLPVAEIGPGDILQVLRPLAHRIGSAVEQAYARNDLLRHRRAVMERWARHVSGQAGAEVVELTR